MIYDKISNMERYPVLKKVKAFLDEQGGNVLDNGKYVIDEDCFVSASEYETGAGKKYEAHRKYIDVQMLVCGREYIKVQNIQKGEPITEYDEKKDIIFYKADAESTYVLDGSNFLLLDTDDLHNPGLAIDKPTQVKKYVFKIKKRS